jgi:hypothetical protein
VDQVRGPAAGGLRHIAVSSFAGFHSVGPSGWAVELRLWHAWGRTLWLVYYSLF